MEDMDKCGDHPTHRRCPDRQRCGKGQEVTTDPLASTDYWGHAQARHVATVSMFSPDVEPCFFTRIIQYSGEHASN